MLAMRQPTICGTSASNTNISVTIVTLAIGLHIDTVKWSIVVEVLSAHLASDVVFTQDPRNAITGLSRLMIITDLLISVTSRWTGYVVLDQADPFPWEKEVPHSVGCSAQGLVRPAYV